MPASASAKPRPLLALDTPSLYFRAYYGLPRSLTAVDGTPSGAIRGLIHMLTWLLRERQPRAVVAALDADWRPAFRVQAIPTYKAHRVASPLPDLDSHTPAHRAHGASPTGAESLPEGLDHQVEAISHLLPALGIDCFGVEGFEADDVLASIATQHRCNGPVEVVTGDRDLFQLADDAAGVSVISITKGVANYEVMDEQALTQRYGIPARYYAQLAVLRGDPSDGLPGVPGIGEKGAARLLTRYGGLAALRQAAVDGDVGLTARQRATLLDYQQYVEQALVVTQAVTDLPLPELRQHLPQAPTDPDLVADLAQHWKLGNLLDRLSEVLYEGRS